jgi:transposase-like protein
MAKQPPTPAPKKLRPRRTFSVELKKKIVKDFERNLFTAIQIQRRYDVSAASVYKWIRKYSTTDPNVTQVVQMKSEQHRTALLQQEIEELQRMIGQQHVALSLHAKIFEHVSQEVGFDVKKKYAPLFSKISAKTLNDPIQ